MIITVLTLNLKKKKKIIEKIQKLKNLIRVKLSEKIDFCGLMNQNSFKMKIKETYTQRLLINQNAQNPIVQINQIQNVLNPIVQINQNQNVLNPIVPINQDQNRQFRTTNARFKSLILEQLSLNLTEILLSEDQMKETGEHIF
jgi:hypothetical protein